MNNKLLRKDTEFLLSFNVMNNDLFTIITKNGLLKMITLQEYEEYHYAYFESFDEEMTQKTLILGRNYLHNMHVFNNDLCVSFNKRDEKTLFVNVLSSEAVTVQMLDQESGLLIEVKHNLLKPLLQNHDE